MQEQQLIIAIDKATAQARFHAYELAETNSELAETLDMVLRKATGIIAKRLRKIGAKTAVPQRG